MEDISWMEEDIVECTPTIPFFSTSSVGMVGFVDPHKVVAWRNAFIVFGNAQNDVVLEAKNFFLVMQGWNIHFHKWKEIWIYNKSLN